MDNAAGDNSDKSVVTLQEALEEYEELEKVSTAVLGASDPNNCSYSKGYMKRQALYACLTCNPKSSPLFQEAGVCLACSYKCHDGHEMIELYTKRNFRCDCGNKKFPDNPCVLQKEKDDYNELNSYNQNFTGTYCTCHRPYPDPDESEETADPMVQCVVCEDWYHTQHAIPGISWDYYDDEEQSLELICGACKPKVEFLSYYSKLQAKPKVKETSVAEENGDNPKENANTVTASSITKDSLDKDRNHEIEDPVSQDSGIGSLTESEPTSIPSVQPDSKTGIKSVSETNEVSVTNCPLLMGEKVQLPPDTGTIWGSGWRKKLCRCSTCKAKYDSLKVTFLIDDEDTMENYEAKGIAKSESDMLHAEESFNKQVNALGRVGQIELISGYNDMKEALKEYLQNFARDEKVVEEKDIQDFFETYRANKRPRLDQP